MKKFAKILACAAASFTFLACLDTGTNAVDSNDKVNQKCKTPSNDVPIHQNIIACDVKEWMDEQLASGGKEREPIFFLVRMYERSEDMYFGSGFNSITGDLEYYINNKVVSFEEYNERINKFTKYEITRDLVTSGEIVSNRMDSWVVLMTAKEITELTENYKGFEIEFYIGGFMSDGNYIEADVRKWVKEQLASGGNEKREVYISDMQIPQIDMNPISGSYISNSDDCYINDQKMSVNECEEYMMNKYWAEYYAKLEAAKRNLPFLGVSEMTAVEVNELTKNYKELAISFFMGFSND
jgi:hypothetical protein